MTATAPIDPAIPLAQLTRGRILSGMDENRVPMVSQILRIISDISGQSERMSVGDLVEFVDGEPTLMGRILTIANSVGYNVGHVEISSIHHAVSLIGFNRVRTLAVSILLLEGAHSQSVAQANRELAGMALISGLVAAEMCRRGVGPDADLGFICGALRNYGRMLAATFLPTEYAAATLAGRPGAEESFAAIFGLTPLELCHQIMADRLLPKTILNTLVARTPEERRYCSATATDTLSAAADFGLRFAEMLQGAELSRSNFERRVEDLSREYTVEFLLRRAEVRELVTEVIAVLECFRYRAGSFVGSIAVFRNLESLAAERVLPPTMEMAAAPAARNPTPPPPPTADSYEI